MNCTAARDLMLEADLADLRGTTESDLSLHVRDCASCAAAAQQVLAAERELGRALGAAAPNRAADEAIRRARPSRRRWMWGALPLAAAATLAVLVLEQRSPVEPTPPPGGPGPAVAAHIAVEAPPGRSVAVFNTDNPDIVVIWFF